MNYIYHHVEFLGFKLWFVFKIEFKFRLEFEF
jgi:hypothetical protein